MKQTNLDSADALMSHLTTLVSAYPDDIVSVSLTSSEHIVVMDVKVYSKKSTSTSTAERYVLTRGLAGDRA